LRNDIEGKYWLTSLPILIISIGDFDIISLTLPLHGKAGVANTPFLFYDEIHINAGKHIVNNYFDWNRLFSGLGDQFTSILTPNWATCSVSATAGGNKYANINAIRLFVLHDLDSRLKEE
jgi:hypothetical protein